MWRKFVKFQGGVAAPEKLRFQVSVVPGSLKCHPNETLIF
jgi:hypothetical protein